MLLRNLAAAAGAAALLLSTAGTASAASSRGIDATLTLIVHADAANAAPVETSFRLVAPVREPNVQQILTNDPSSPAYAMAIGSLLSRIGLYQQNALVQRLAVNVDKPPQVSVSGGRASIFFRGSRELGDYVAGLPGPWDIERRGDRLRICVARSRAVGADSRWRVDLYVAGAQVLTARPTPDDFQQVVNVPGLGDAQTVPATPAAGDGNVRHLDWTLTGSPSTSAGSENCAGYALFGMPPGTDPLVVDIRLPRATRALLDAFAGRWSQVRLALSYLATTLVFLLLVAVCLRRKLTPLRRRVGLAIAAWLALLGGAAATWLLAGSGNDATLAARRPSLVAAGVAALLAAAAVSRRCLLWAAGPIALVTGLAWVAQTHVDRHAYRDVGWGAIALATAPALAVTVMTFLAAAVLTMLLIGGKARRFGIAGGVTMLIAALVVAQAAAAGYALWHNGNQATHALNSGLFVSPKGWVVGALANFPFPFVGFAIDLLVVVAFAIVLAALRLLGRTAASPLLRAGEELVPVLAGIVFVAFVVGTQGLLYGWNAPLAFVLALVLAFACWRLIRHPRLAKISDDAAALNDEQPDGGALLVRARGELLERALELVELRRRLAGIPADDERKRHELAKRIHEVEAGTPGSVRLPDGVSPGHVAIGLGPGNSWWETASLAVRRGALLAIVPVGFFVYVLVAHRLAHDLSPWSTLGLADVIRGSLYEMLFWLSAALVLGLLYPYLPTAWGAVKGAVIAAVYTAAVGLSAWILPGGAGDWAFRAFELFLFLVALGVVLDRETLRRGGAPDRYLADFYRVGDVRYVSSYATAAAGALALVTQQLQSGHGQAAIVEIVKNIPVLIPPVH